MNKIDILKLSKLKRNNELNHSYFNQINNCNKAWVLGFIQADGNISDSYRLSFCLSEKDIEIYTYFKQEFGNIPFRENKTFLKITNKYYNQIRFYLNSKEIYIDLINIGITPRKTGNEKLINISNTYIYPYIRGIFDGDGSIGIYKYKNKSTQYNFQITSSSKMFLEQINTYLPMCYIKQRKNYYDLLTNSKKNIIDIYKLLYNDNGYFLNRKNKNF